MILKVNLTNTCNLKFFEFNTNFSLLSALLPLVSRLFIRRRPYSIYDVIIILEFVSIIIDCICLSYAARKQNNWPFINSFIIFQVFILFTIFYSYNRKKWALVFLVIFACFAVYNFYLYPLQPSMHTATNLVGSAFLIAFGIDCINKIMEELPVKHLYDHPIFWVCCGVFFYFTGNLLPFLFNNQYLELNLMDFKSHWALHNFLNIVKNVCLALAIWTNYRMRLL